ncbi:hypothetical protein H8959_021896 [Pygathrix nigripes]
MKPDRNTCFFNFEPLAKRSPTRPAKPITPSRGKNPAGIIGPGCHPVRVVSSSDWPISLPVSHQMDGMPVPMKNEMPISQLLMILAPSLGFVLLALLVAFLLRGKLMETNCLQKHTRLDCIGDSKNVLNDMRHGREDEDGLFTL